MPAGVVGNSNNSNVGINVTNPSAKLDIATDQSVGAMQLRTTGGGSGPSSNPYGVGISPYALQVLHNDYSPITASWQTYVSANLSATGVLKLGSFSGINAIHQLNAVSKGIGVYSSSADYISLSYLVVPGFSGPALNYKGTNQNFSFTYNNQVAMQITPSQKVLIGTDLAPGNHKLYVGGSAIAEEVVVKLQSNWPDYVFTPRYKMLSTADLRNYIQKNAKLPYLADAESVAKDGLHLGETQAQLTRLVEELTLRLLQMDERIAELEGQLAK